MHITTPKEIKEEYQRIHNSFTNNLQSDYNISTPLYGLEKIVSLFSPIDANLSINVTYSDWFYKHIIKIEPQYDLIEFIAQYIAHDD